MSNPNTVTVYSPANEPFEMSRVNARDLCAHAGWSMKPLDGYTPPVAEPTDSEEEANAADSEGSIEDAETAEDEDAETNEDSGEEETESTVIRKEEADFDDLETREEVVAYLAETFPDFKPHHLAKRDGLITKAIELAAQ